MLVERARQHALERGIERGALRAEQVPGQREVRRADADIHRAGPLHPEARRVGRQEVEYLMAEFAGVDLGVVLDQRQCRQMLQPAELPRHLDVDPAYLAIDDVAPPCARVPAEARLEVDLPVDRHVSGRDQPPEALRFGKGGRRQNLGEPTPVAVDGRSRDGREHDTLQPRARHAMFHVQQTRAQQVEPVFEGEVGIACPRRGTEVQGRAG